MTKYSSPQAFFPVAGKLIPWFACASLAFCVFGAYVGFFVAPSNVHQGEAYRIIFLHVPTAWMSLFLYAVMAFWAAAGLGLKSRVPSMMASALAPTGAVFTFLALWTGALWGKPTWGTWWVWDARMTTELVLLFLYLAFMALQASVDDPRRADRAGAVLALAGIANLPLIYFSVEWWNTLHRGASIGLRNPEAIPTPMLVGMLIMALGFWMYSITAALLRVRCILLERERHTEWVADYVERPS